MGLDIRFPIGMMFSLLGVVLAGYGLATGADDAMYRSSLGTNINLWWGLVLFVFGAVMLFLALKEKFSRRG